MCAPRPLPFFLVVFLVAIPVFAQSTSTTSPTSNPQAVALLQKSVDALTGGVAVSDVTLTGNAHRIAGSDDELGQFTLEAKGTQESKIALTLSGSTYAEVHNVSEGSPAGSYASSDSTVEPLAQHNCFTDPAWFFPALSSLASALSNPTENVAYVGQETLDGTSVQHVRVWLTVQSPDAAAIKLIAHLSTIDWYLDTSSLLPVAEEFTTHPADNASLDLSVEIRFSNYQRTDGVLVPLHVQKFLNGGLTLDLNITSVSLNTSPPDSDFQL
jgi:hypothetical protein